MAEKNAPEKIGRFDTGLIRELAAILREADLGEIEIEQAGMRIRVVKPKSAQIAYAAPTHAPQPPAQVGPAPVSPSPAAASAPARPADHPGAVKSPMVGTVYLAPEAGAATFIKVGDAVKEGQTLLLVEAMKTFNPVTAPRAGKVSALLVANEQPVEFGEPLVVIE